jgi:hypothetical protein
MEFWDDLSVGVKRYLIIGVVLVVALLAFRACFGAEREASPPPRGAAAG